MSQIQSARLEPEFHSLLRISRNAEAITASKKGQTRGAIYD